MSLEKTIKWIVVIVLSLFTGIISFVFGMWIVQGLLFFVVVMPTAVSDPSNTNPLSVMFGWVPVIGGLIIGFISGMLIYYKGKRKLNRLN
ncbi:MAG: hypothetical protein ABH986_05140 [archaeon]